MAAFGKNVWRKLTTPFGRNGEEAKHHPYRHPSHFTDDDRQRALAARVPAGKTTKTMSIPHVPNMQSETIT